MDDNQEYDLLLRSIFDNCDIAGTGLLSPEEFQQLCTQLQLENQYPILNDMLFKHRSAVTYENFKEGLLLLLSGSLDEKQDDEESEKMSKMSEKEALYDEDLNGNDIKYSSSTPKRKTKRSEKTRYEDSNWYAGENLFNDENVVSSYDNAPGTFRRSSNSIPPTAKGGKHRKYGRKSKPEKSSSWSQQHHNQSRSHHQQHQQTPSSMQDSEEETSKSESIHHRLTPRGTQEITAVGDGGTWAPPQSDITSTPIRSRSSDSESKQQQQQAIEDDRSSYVQEALGQVWRQVIGDIGQQIDVSQLQELFQALSLTSSVNEVQQLFNILDTDYDGLICFDDFVRQMAVYMTTGEEQEVEQPRDDVINLNYEECGVTPLPQTPELKSPTDSPHATLIGGLPTPTMIDANQSLEETMQHLNSSIEMQPIVVSTPCKSTNSSDQGTSSSISPSISTNTSFSEYDGASSKYSSMGRPSPQGSIVDAPIIDVPNYEGVPLYRRRSRRSNPSTKRSRNRTRSIKGVALPHYHPISRKRVEELPLYYLTDIDGRYVEVDRLKSIWDEEGLEDTDQLLEEFGINKDDSFSIEAFSESLETELDTNRMHKAACALYKGGIKHYRSQTSENSSEKTKMESDIQHLYSQIHEQEERIEKMEIDFQYRLQSALEESKREIARLTNELTSATNCARSSSEREINELRMEIEELEKNEISLSEQVATLTSDHKAMETENRLKHEQLVTANSNMEKLQSDFDQVCSDMLVQHNAHVAQQQELELLVEAYQRQIKRSKDENDEAMARMKSMKKRWSSSVDNGKKQPTKPDTSSSRNQPSSQHQEAPPPPVNHPKPTPRPRNSLTGCSPTPHHRVLPNILPNDPDLSLTEVQEATKQLATTTTTSSLYHEMKSSWGS